MTDQTADKARDLLDGTTPGPWGVDHDHAWAPGVWSPDSIVFGPYYDREDMEQWEPGSAADLRLAAAAPTLATMIAGMREEWGVAVTYPGLAEVVEWGFCTRDGAEAEGNILDTEYRIVRRYVTTPEEA